MLNANGVGSGRHWLWGLGITMPLSSSSPFFFTTSAACGLKIGLVKSPTTLWMMVPSDLRSLLTIGPGPDNGGSKLNQRPHMPDKSGMDTPLFASLLGDSVRGVNVCVFWICLKYRKSGGAWSFLVGIRWPSPLRKYPSLPISTSPLPSAQTSSTHSGCLICRREYVFVTVHGRVNALSIVVISSWRRFGSALSE